MRWYEKANAIRKTIRPKMTYERMGALLNVHRSTVHAWFCGRNNITPEEAEAIASVLGVSVMELLSGDDMWLRDDEERAWITHYRSLDEGAREALARALGVQPLPALPQPSEETDEND